MHVIQTLFALLSTFGERKRFRCRKLVRAGMPAVPGPIDLFLLPTLYRNIEDSLLIFNLLQREFFDLLGIKAEVFQHSGCDAFA